MLKNNPDTLKVVFKNFPLRNHKMALPAAEDAMAAHDQGRFWDFHDKIFSYITSPGRKRLDKKELDKIPVDLGLEMPRYLESLKNPALKELILRDLQEGQKAGVTGTPTLFINGRKVNNRSPLGIQRMITHELQKLKGKTVQ